MIIWLPLAGIVAALNWFIDCTYYCKIKRIKFRLSNISFSIYMASHIFSNFKSVTGGAGIGRKVAKLKLFGVDFENGLEIGTFFLEKKSNSLFICF